MNKMNQYYYLDGYQSYLPTRNADVVLTEFFFKLSPKHQRKILKRIKQEQRKCKQQLAIEIQQTKDAKTSALEWAQSLDVTEYTKAVPVAVVPLTNSGWTPPSVDWESWKNGEIKYKRAR